MYAVKTFIQNPYIDVDGNLIIPHKYYRAQPFSEGRAAVIREEYVSIVNEGILLVPISPFTYINREGNVAIETDFDEAGEFHELFRLFTAVSVHLKMESQWRNRRTIQILCI